VHFITKYVDLFIKYVYKKFMFKAAFAKKAVNESPLKRSAIAEEMGITTETLTLYLNGHLVPPKIRVRILAKTLNVPDVELWNDGPSAKSGSGTRAA
jgi:transcriptional regulator with XRE-family HTH domain